MRGLGDIKLADLRALTQSIGDLTEVHSFAGLQERVFAALGQFAPGSFITNDQIDLEHHTYSQVRNHAITSEETLVPRFGELALQGHHPYIEYVRNGGTGIAVRMTDLVPMRNFERNPIFDEVYKPGGIPYGMFAMMPIKAPVPFLSFAILRDRNFSDSEQDLARLYLEQVHRTVLRLMDQSNRMERIFLAHCKMFRLTARETEVMLLLFKGKTDKEIAASTGASPRTVSNQVAAVFQKIGARTRVEAARRILDGPPLQRRPPGVAA